MIRSPTRKDYPGSMDRHFVRVFGRDSLETSTWSRARSLALAKPACLWPAARRRSDSCSQFYGVFAAEVTEIPMRRQASREHGAFTMRLSTSTHRSRRDVLVRSAKRHRSQRRDHSSINGHFTRLDAGSLHRTWPLLTALVRLPRQVEQVRCAALASYWWRHPAPARRTTWRTRESARKFEIRQPKTRTAGTVHAIELVSMVHARRFPSFS